jgi:hypothetical protein
VERRAAAREVSARGRSTGTLDTRGSMTHDQAKALVETHLATLARSTGGDSAVIVDSATIERDFGWVFFYQSRRFLETRDPIWKLAGNAPYIVNRLDGALHVTGTARPIEEYIAQYEHDLAKHV